MYLYLLLLLLLMVASPLHFSSLHCSALSRYNQHINTRRVTYLGSGLRLKDERKKLLWFGIGDSVPQVPVAYELAPGDGIIMTSPPIVLLPLNSP